MGRVSGLSITTCWWGADNISPKPNQFSWYCHSGRNVGTGQYHSHKWEITPYICLDSQCPVLKRPILSGYTFERRFTSTQPSHDTSQYSKQCLDGRRSEPRRNYPLSLPLMTLCARNPPHQPYRRPVLYRNVRIGLQRNMIRESLNSYLLFSRFYTPQYTGDYIDCQQVVTNGTGDFHRIPITIC